MGGCPGPAMGVCALLRPRPLVLRGAIAVSDMELCYPSSGRFQPQGTLRPAYRVIFTYGPGSKRVIEDYDAERGDYLR